MERKIMETIYSFIYQPETIRKLCLSEKFLHQKIRWNCGIFRSAVQHVQLVFEKEDPRKNATFSRSWAESLFTIWLGLATIILHQWYWFLHHEISSEIPPWRKRKHVKITATVHLCALKPTLQIFPVGPFTRFLQSTKSQTPCWKVFTKKSIAELLHFAAEQ